LVAVPPGVTPPSRLTLMRASVVPRIDHRDLTIFPSV
jgi:hypothetical protein